MLTLPPSLAARSPLDWVQRGLLLVAWTCLGACAWMWMDAKVYQVLESRRLDRLIHAGAKAPGAADWATNAVALDAGQGSDALIGRLEIPRLHYSAIVAEGIDKRTLRRAIGHLPETALPGEAGNVVLAGHRDSFFRILKEVRPDDRLRFATTNGWFEYTIVDLAVVDPHEIQVLEPSEKPTLTLITCYPFNYIGPAPRRFVVRALQTL